MHVYLENPAIVELGFTLRREAQGQGYAQEAIQALINSLFQLGTISKIVCISDLRNERSIRLLKRLGMHLVRSAEVEFKGELCIEQTFELEKEGWVFRKTG